LSLPQTVRTEQTLGYGPFLLGHIGLDIIGNSFVFLSIPGFKPVKYPGRIGTGSNAESASNAALIVYQYDAIFPLESGINRAHFGTGWIVAMLTGFRHEVRGSLLGLLHLKHIDVVLLRS
jgi:hypothetical protein